MICGLEMLTPDRRTGRTLLYTLLLAGFTSVLAGCDKEPTKLQKMAASANAPPPPPPTAAPPPPVHKPTLTVDEGSVMVDGERVDFTAPDPRGRLLAILTSKPKVAGEELVVVVQRKTKTPHVALVLDTVRAARATGVKVKTRARDKTTLELEMKFDATAKDCSAVAFIAKDGAITAWTVAGRMAARYARGMAGPDLTIGSAGVRKVAAACDASTWVVSADDSIIWGLVVDLIGAVRSPDDGGIGMRAQTVIVPSEAPVPGRKVKLP